MGRRRGIAATLVSVIFFTTLLLANGALYAAGGSYLSSALLTSAQQRESAYGDLLVGLSSFSSLSAAEDYLGSHAVGCSSAPSYLASMGGSDSSSGNDQGMEYIESTTWSYTPSGPTGDNLTLIQPFEGFSNGALNLLVTTNVQETWLGGLPSYHEQQEQVVHLPIEPEGLTSLCLSALSLFRQNLSSSLASCNSSSVQSVLDATRSSHPSLDSVEVGGSAQLSSGVCTIAYWVTIAQSYEGVSGTSEWSVFGAQSFSN